MTSRDQLTHERQEALIDLLVHRGVIEPDEAKALLNSKELGDAKQCLPDEAADASRRQHHD